MCARPMIKAILRVERDCLLLVSHCGGLSPVEVGEFLPIGADRVSGQAISGGKDAHSTYMMQQGIRDFDGMCALSDDKPVLER